MDKGVTCEHLNKLADVLGKDIWQSKEALVCFDCGCPGPNLWICLQPNCHHVGCSEVKNDHSTAHQKNFPSHCVHMNVSTERIWCYLCEKEVYIQAAIAYAAISPDTTSQDGSTKSSRLASSGLSLAPDENLDDEDMDYDDDDSQTRGLVGLQNMGNTCYMNAALQALSNTAPLTSYFLECAAAVAILAGDKKPGLSRAYQKLVKEMWSRKTRGYVVPNGILYGIRNVHPMFRGYHQHDAQEFLRCFMDQLHEELKEPIMYGMEEDKVVSDADGDHHEPRYPMRRRAASSGASDAPFFARMRRKSPASSSYSETRTDGYMRFEICGTTNYANYNISSLSSSWSTPIVITPSVQESNGPKHRRSASFGGTHYAYNVFTQQSVNGTESQRDSRREQSLGSSSELSCSSSAEERYETCSSGASDSPDPAPAIGESSVGGGDGGSDIRYKSIISDVFDGKLLSSVQCLVCNRVSTRVETFQDLSLPIPSREHLAVLRCQQPHNAPLSNDSWLWWLLGWFRSWLYGPVVSLQDCLAAFFSADELKGDNMYSCSRCNKLRNGVKTSGVLRLPEVLCIHLKRFRHELMFSSKVAARVSFPLASLDMTPYKHPGCRSAVARYALCAVIRHTGTAAGGHYTCAARTRAGWASFDDAAVTPISPHQLAHSEAYVLFYRKVNPQMAVLRQRAAEILESSCAEPNDIKFYISKQWINKFNTWAEPGPIDNSDFVCIHGGVRPERARVLHSLAAVVTQPLWQLLHDHFGGGPAVSHVHECGACARAARRLRSRRAAERAAFCRMHQAFQDQEHPHAIYALSMHWFRQWQAFVRNKAPRPPPPLDNSGIVSKQEIDGKVTFCLKQGSDHAQISEELWRFFLEIYGGGPEVRLRSPVSYHTAAQQTVFNETGDNQYRITRKYSESDKEDYCSKSTSDTNIRGTDTHTELQRNQSLQHIDRQYTAKRTEEYKVNNHEMNGNYDTEDEMEQMMKAPIPLPAPPIENGLDSSDYDANDNFVKVETPVPDSELPNLDSISLKSKPKPARVRKAKRRTVK